MKLYFCDLETNKELEELNSSNIYKLKNYSKIVGLAVTDSICLYYIIYINETTKFKIKIKGINALSFAEENSKNQIKYFESILEKLWLQKTKEDKKESDSLNDYFYC